MSKIIFLIILFFLCFFFIKENNSARARVIFIFSFISILFFNILIFFNYNLKKNILDLFEINEFELLLSLAIIFISFYTIYIYLEIKKVKEKLTFIIRSLALQKNNGKKNKNRIKK